MALGYILRQDLEKFLYSGTIEELTNGKKAIGSTPAVAGDDSVWQGNAPTAIEHVKGYSRQWYDMDTEMREIVAYDAGTANTEGQRVAGAAVSGVRPLYICIQDAPAGTALTDTNYYTETDDRNPVVLEITCLIVIYNISRRYNPNQIPEQRQIDYDRATDQLKDIQKGRIQLDIAERVFEEDSDAYDDPGQNVAFGGFDDITQDDY